MPVYPEVPHHRFGLLTIKETHILASNARAAITSMNTAASLLGAVDIYKKSSLVSIFTTDCLK